MAGHKRFSLAISRQVDAWLHDLDAAPDPDSLVMNAHFAGVTFSPTISRFTIEELKSTGDIRLLSNQALQRFLKASGEEAPPTLAEIQRSTPEIGASRADADRILCRMRTRPNFEGHLRDRMYWAHLSAQLLDGVAISAEELDAAITQELKALSR